MSLQIITRAAWQARPPRGSYTTLIRTRGTKVHYVGNRVDPRLVDDHDRCLALMRQIQGWHMDGNGWMDFAYNLAVCPHGNLLMGRGPGRMSAANGPGLNHDHYAVLGMLGSTGLIDPTDAMLNGLRDAIQVLRDQGGAGSEIKGHRDGYSTDCPGGPLYAWVKAGAPRPGGQPVDPTVWPGRLLRYRPGQPLQRGDDVRRWQQAAATLGHALAVDGLYGEESRAVARRIQRAAGLDDDGVVGPDTWRETLRAR
jgi:peptidoglycan hydrolase-like protein with peptidoglycan-binding domain